MKYPLRRHQHCCASLGGDPIKDVVSKFEGGTGWANPSYPLSQVTKRINYSESIIETLNKDDPNNSFLDAVTEL